MAKASRGAVVEGEALDAGERLAPADDAVDRRLDLLLHRRHGERIPGHLHPERRIGHERVERHHRQHRLDGARGRNAAHDDRLAGDGLHGGRGRRKIGVDDGDLVAVTHAAQSVEQVRVQERIDSPKHACLPVVLSGRSLSGGSGAGNQGAAGASAGQPPQPGFAWSSSPFRLRSTREDPAAPRFPPPRRGGGGPAGGRWRGSAPCRPVDCRSPAPRRFGGEAEAPFRGQPHERPPDIGGERAPFGGGVAQEGRQRFDLLEADPGFVPAADRGDAPGEHALDDRDRLGGEGARVDRAVAEPRLDLGGHAGERLVRLGGAAGEAGETARVEPFVGEPPHERAQARARIGRVGVGRVVDERNAPGAAEGDEVGFRHAEQGPDERDAAAPGRGRHAGKARDARAAQEPEEHRLGLIVGVMGGRDRVGADRLSVSGEQPVARLPRPLLKPGRGLRAGPDERRMRDAEALA